MKIRKKSVRIVSNLVAVTVVTVLIIWVAVSGRDATHADRTGADDQGLSSADASPAKRSGAVIASRAGQASDWPGLPAVVSSQPDTFAPLQPESDDDEIAPDPASDLALVELIGSYDDLEAHQRGEVAYRIASGWMDCRGHRELDDAALRAEVERIVENRKRWLTEMAAHALERNPGRDVAGDVERSIEEFAETSRAARVNAEFRELEAGQDFCRGADNPGYDERNLRYVQWLERAADLGHPAARITFARVAFFWSGTVSVGKAVDLVERKRKVAGYLRQALDQRDPRALLALAGIVREGYYALPDPILEYAYATAAVRALSGNAPGWVPHTSTEPGVDDLNISMLRDRVKKLDSALNPDDLRRAERLSGRLLGPADS